MKSTFLLLAHSMQNSILIFKSSRECEETNQDCGATTFKGYLRYEGRIACFLACSLVRIGTMNEVLIASKPFFIFFNLSNAYLVQSLKSSNVELG